MYVSLDFMDILKLFPLRRLNIFCRQSNLDGEEPLIRHKVQSNSVPIQSSQYIQHSVHTTQSRSLDASTSSHSGMNFS